mgnify:CR=1 FL=1
MSMNIYECFAAHGLNCFLLFAFKYLPYQANEGRRYDTHSGAHFRSQLRSRLSPATAAVFIQIVNLKR